MTTPLKTQNIFYASALAQAHSEAYTDTFKSGFSWLAKTLKTAPGPMQLFDIGCGDGTWLAAARDMKIAGEGIDISADILKIAQKKGLQVRQGSAASTPPPAGTNAVTALGEVLAYKPTALTPCALNIARVLPKNGLFIFDLPGPGTPQNTGSSQGLSWKLEARSFVSGNTLSRQIHIETEDGIVEETHFQHLFSPEEVSDILTGLGFEVQVLTSYGPCEFLPGRYGILARKT